MSSSFCYFAHESQFSRGFRIMHGSPFPGIPVYTTDPRDSHVIFEDSQSSSHIDILKSTLVPASTSCENVSNSCPVLRQACVSGY